MPLVFHAFGDHGQAQVAAQLDDHFGDAAAARGTRDFRHKRAVDFQAVDLQPLQVRQRRKTRAEVVDGDAHARLLDLPQHLDQQVRLFHGHRFRDFQFDELGRRLRLFQRYAQHFQEQRVAELHLRHVDGHDEVAVALFAQQHQFAASRAQHPFTEVDDDARILGNRNETVGRDELAVRRLPAQQRFGAHGAARGQVDLRLIHDKQLVLAEGRAQRMHHAHSFADFDAHAARKIEVPGALLAFCPFQGDIGILQRIGARARMFAQPYEAQGGRQLHVLAIDAERRLEQGQDLGRVDLRRVAQHAKDVAAQARHRQLGTQLGLQSARHGNQQGVAELVPQRIVGLGKMVEVDQRQGGVVARRPGQGGVEDFHQARAVRQLRQLVVEGGVVQVRYQFDIVQADGDVAAKHFQQAFIDGREGARQNQVGGRIAAGLAREIQGGVVVRVDIAPLRQCVLDGRHHARVLQAAQGAVRQAGKAARTGRHEQLLAAIVQHFLHAQHAIGADAQQVGDLRQHAGREVLHAVQRHQLRAGVDDLVQAAPAVADRAYLFVRTDGRRHGGKQLDARQLGLGLVVVDVVVADGVDFRRIAGLPCAQDDAHVRHFEGFADVAHQVQARVILFHHHVEQDDGDVVFMLEQFARLAGRIRMHEFQRAVLHFQVAQGESGGGVDVFIVVDDHHPPDAARCDGQRRRWLLIEEYQVVVIVLVSVKGDDRCGHV